jgi:hypothetical protein
LKSANFLQFEGEEMKKLILALVLSLAVVMMVTPASAMELWDPHLRGSSEGLAAGALPPPGFYFIDQLYMMPGLQQYNGNGDKVLGNHGTNLFVFVDAPILLWSTGCKFLCADYAVAIAEPIVYTNLRVGDRGESLSGDNWGTFGTVIVPYILSWKLPCDWRVKTALNITMNDGSSNLSNSLLGGNPAKPFMAPSSNDYYDFIPELGISWLHGGWNFSADFFFSFETKDQYTNYQSGNAFFADYTITKTCGKWSFGLGAAQYNQLNCDTVNGHNVSESTTTMYTMGPIIAYNFGPCEMIFTYNFALYSQDQFGGDYAFLDIIIPLGNPCGWGCKK